MERKRSIAISNAFGGWKSTRFGYTAIYKVMKMLLKVEKIPLLVMSPVRSREHPNKTISNTNVLMEVYTPALHPNEHN